MSEEPRRRRQRHSETDESKDMEGRTQAKQTNDEGSGNGGGKEKKKSRSKVIGLILLVISILVFIGSAGLKDLNTIYGGMAFAYILLIPSMILIRRPSLSKKQIESLKKSLTKLKKSVAEKDEVIASYRKYEFIKNVEEECLKIKEEAESTRRRANQEYQEAQTKAEAMIAKAEEQAREIAGNAYELKGKARELERTAEAIKRRIEGYGDSYIIPSYSLLDDLAKEFEYEDAGQALKEAREKSRRMVREGKAASCEYVEENRRTTAIRFVVDAFNGKADSILSNVKSDNFGTLKKKMEDAFVLVNANGRSFRNAVILNEYLDARLNELKWACVAQELRQRKIQEQREIRERIREEERARREYEKAQRDAQKEEEMLQRAMEKAKADLAAASDEQRAKFEGKILDLQQKLKEAEEKSQRALSMAQQTRAGNVYVISNVGAFGENVYKIGMTRRLDPLDRVRELGDASVPFAFDVHAIIYSDDAPTLETELHRAFMHAQMNKVNPRKEFFRVGIKEIRQLTEKMGLKASWTMEAEAAEYRETKKIDEQIKNDLTVRAQWERNMEARVRENDEEEIVAS